MPVTTRESRAINGLAAYAQPECAHPQILIEEHTGLIKKIALKSQLPYDDIKTIFNHFAVVEKRDQIDDFLLVNLHHALQKFYDNCK